MISGKTTLVAHLGYPTFAFKAPLIYNPWFEKNGIDAVVVPMGVQVPDYPDFFRALFKLTNIRGALVTMPHKVTTIELVDELTPTAKVAGAANAVLAARGRDACWATSSTARASSAACSARASTSTGKKVLVVGNGGVGSPIAASLAAAGVACDGPVRPERRGVGGAGGAAARGLPRRWRSSTGSKDPAGHDLVVNATPLGMKDDDPLPMDVDRIGPGTFVGEVVMKQEITPFLRPRRTRAARSRWARTCCSSRSRPTWSSSASAPPLPTSCAPSSKVED